MDAVGMLMQLLSPAEAEAKVTPSDAYTQRLVSTIESQGQQFRQDEPVAQGTSNPQLRDIYRQVLLAAQRRPEEVRLSSFAMPDFPALGMHTAPGAPGETHQIRLNRGFPYEGGNASTHEGPQRNLAHELLHFLFGVATPAGTRLWDAEEAQHNVIDFLLGTSSMGIPKVSLDYYRTSHNLDPKYLAGVTQPQALIDLFRQLFADPALVQRLEQDVRTSDRMRTTRHAAD